MDEQIIKNRLKILPEKLRLVLLNDDWIKNTKIISGHFSLDEEKSFLLENEVFFVLLGFELKTNFVENIKKELGVESDTANKIMEEMEKNVFSEISEELNQIKNTPPKTSAPQNQSGATHQTTHDSVGQSFEQIILNQAKAMQPAREAGGSSQQQVVSSKVPENIPTEQEKTRVTLPNHSNSQDPYRETLT